MNRTVEQNWGRLILGPSLVGSCSKKRVESQPSDSGESRRYLGREWRDSRARGGRRCSLKPPPACRRSMIRHLERPPATVGDAGRRVIFLVVP
jgi:hypothetical protein